MHRLGDGQSWLKWKTEYGKNWEKAFRQKYEAEMRDRFDTHFYVGTINQDPSEWIVVGLFYPLKVPPKLF
jgi:hypothetical protein